MSWFAFGAANTASAAVSTNVPYECRPRDPSIKVPPIIALPGNSPAAIEESEKADNFHPLCPSGEVPYSTAPPLTASATFKIAPPGVAAAAPHRGTKGLRPERRRSTRLKRAREARSNIGGYWYSWALGEQAYIGGENVNGLWVRQSNEQPYIDYTKGQSQWPAHSLAQLWAIENGHQSCFSDVETGWIESYGLEGDVQPHLFIYAFDCGVGLGYVGKSSIPWVQSSNVVFPNSIVTHNDTWHTYGVHLYGSNWWLYYDGQWVGYIPPSAWTRRFPVSLWNGEAGGEVETPEQITCTDMGWNGRYGSNPEAAMFKEVWYESINNGGEGKWAKLRPWNSDAQYTTGNWYQGIPGWQFRYGGPGWC